MDIKESVTKYIEERNNKIKEFNESIKRLDADYVKRIEKACTIKIDDVFSHPTHAYGKDGIKYYKVSELKTGVDGVVSIWGNKLTNKHLWSKKYLYMFSTSLYTDFKSNSGFTKVTGKELIKLLNEVSAAEGTIGVIPEANVNE